ncbi:hypothetical protein SUGI_1525210 [Cryptomeria japonica]|uniref:Uncharacterized protein n=1 Tax=Cryptomeria japonica TaxID=3369 RepID=A0AAD3NPP1_CRYJA|nr:hypothetical protein SUGI_1224590 [Cryptomeria japonica]GLJ59870.1 hypothetical protein SUGI_1525210 [Cryptomeria japonica]
MRTVRSAPISIVGGDRFRFTRREYFYSGSIGRATPSRRLPMLREAAPLPPGWIDNNWIRSASDKGKGGYHSPYLLSHLTIYLSDRPNL